VTDHPDEVHATAGLRTPYEAVMLLSVLRTVIQTASTKHGPFSKT
jgi:hypothetical protein